MAIHTVDWEATPPEECRHGSVAIGNFDGVHRGHLALLVELCRLSRSIGGPAVVLTFDPHPLQLLRPENFQPVLTTLRDRAELLQAHGADQVLIVRTTSALLQRSADEFFLQMIRTRLDARGLVEGANFRFGHNREGSIEQLGRLCHEAGLHLVVVPSLTTSNGVPISSSRVRAALLDGDMKAARALLGRPFHLRGIVGVGQRRGQSLGFPTANLEGIETLIPRDGVYAVRVEHSGRLWPGAANIGANPTFGEQARKVEVHLAGFDGNLYGQELVVDFIDWLRDTRAFANGAQLQEQLRQDVDRARQIVGAFS